MPGSRLRTAAKGAYTASETLVGGDLQCGPCIEKQPLTHQEKSWAHGLPRVSWVLGEVRSGGKRVFPFLHEQAVWDSAPLRHVDQMGASAMWTPGSHQALFKRSDQREDERSLCHSKA